MPAGFKDSADPHRIRPVCTHFASLWEQYDSSKPLGIVLDDILKAAAPLGITSFYEMSESDILDIFEKMIVTEADTE